MMEALTAPQTQGRNPELDLAHRHRTGDATALEEIYQIHGGIVFNLSFRMAGSREEAEDLTQEIFLRIHRHFGKFNGRSSLKTWIYRVTINHCRSRLGRKRWFFRPLAEEVGDEEESGAVVLQDQGRNPEDLALAQDAARRVDSGLRRIKPIFREAVILRDLEGLTYDEIAEVLSVRIGTVRSRIARGRDQLRKAMEEKP